MATNVTSIKNGAVCMDSLRLREHDQRSELQHVCRAPRQRREQRASTDARKSLSE